MGNLKLQFWSFDLVFSVTVFAVALTILTFTWYNINSQMSIAYGSSPTLMQMQAQSVASGLLSQGSPSDWNSLVNLSNSSSWGQYGIGIGSPDGASISPSKLYTAMAMANSNYEATKQGMGVTYQYYIMIYNRDINLTFGSNPAAGGALTIDVATFDSNINGNPVTVKVMIWTNNQFGVA